MSFGRAHDSVRLSERKALEMDHVQQRRFDQLRLRYRRNYPKQAFVGNRQYRLSGRAFGAVGLRHVEFIEVRE